MVRTNGGRSTVRARTFDQAITFHRLERRSGWAGVNSAICEAGGCNNPKFTNRGLQTEIFAQAKLLNIFGPAAEV